MSNKEILLKLYKIAAKQQKIINKLAGVDDHVGMYDDEKPFEDGVEESIIEPIETDEFGNEIISTPSGMRPIVSDEYKEKFGPELGWASDKAARKSKRANEFDSPSDHVDASEAHAAAAELADQYGLDELRDHHVAWAKHHSSRS